MKQKGFWFRMVPMFIMVAATVVMSINIYFQMIETEEEICWQRLEIATNSTSGKIETRINDNLNFLDAAADAYILIHDIHNLEAVGEYIDSVAERTIFERIDVILPDETLITQKGETAERGGESTYAELERKGTHITQRRTSSFTGEKIICCVTPIEDDGKVLGLLVGTISCKAMSELFEVFTYGEACQLFVIDRADGNYLMDNWHEELGNIYDLDPRKSADGDEMIDFVPTIINGEQERFVYISESNGEKSYQYCAPLESFGWEVCVVVQEDVVFANVNELKSNLFKAGLVELLVVLLYVLWHISMNIITMKNEKRVQHLEYEKAKNEAKAAFISNMSHDIKTPLNGIMGMLHIIKNHKMEPEVVDDCLQKIEISAQYLSTLTSDILDISEIENDKMVLPTESIDLEQMMDELTAMMERQAGEMGVTYILDRSGLKKPCILGSSVHIKRILINLIGNAIKYSKNAGKNVWVTVYDEPINGVSGKRMYHFIIKDNGIGMSEAFQKNMYKAFEQEKIDARSEYQGYGLGLTIVNHLLKKMGGIIELESVKGVGSTFIVSIPLQPDTGKRVYAIEEKTGFDISGLHLLLVEDNAFNMEIANVLLKDAGAVVDTAVNGKIAAELFAASAPYTYDGIIMDVMMPVMDGCEAAETIRKTERPDAKSVPIIAMTASTFAEDISRCRAAGMNDHVPKPVDVNLLMSTIMEHCKKH